MKTKKSVDLIYDKSVIDFKLGVMREVNTFLEKEVDENNEKTGRSWEELANSGTVQIYYNAKDEKGNSELINYTGFEYEYTNYSQKTVVKEIEERFTKVGKEIKEELKSLVKDGKYIENKDNKELYLKYFNQSLELFEEYDNQRKEERREFMRNNDKENIKKKDMDKEREF